MRSWHSLCAASLSLLLKFSVATRFLTHNCDVELCLTKCTEPWAPRPMRRTSVQRASGLASIVASAAALIVTVDGWPGGWCELCAGGQLAPASAASSRARGSSRSRLQGQLSPNTAAEAAPLPPRPTASHLRNQQKWHCNGFIRHGRQIRRPFLMCARLCAASGGLGRRPDPSRPCFLGTCRPRRPRLP